jgi:hypothetical protein
MRVVLGFLVGLLIGAGGLIWFYTYGGKIMIAGRELGPPITYVKGDDAPKPPETKTPRVVVRDITDEVASPPPVVPRPDGSAGENRPGSISGSPWFVIVWPRW